MLFPGNFKKCLEILDSNCIKTIECKELAKRFFEVTSSSSKVFKFCKVIFLTIEIKG